MTTPNSNPTILFKALIGVQITPADAEILDGAFSNEPDFLDGLEMVATVMALRALPGTLPPASAPWKQMYETMLDETQNGVSIEDAWRSAIEAQPQDLQFAITNAVNARIKPIMEFEAQKGKKRFKSKDYARELRQMGYEFRWNECGGVLEVNGKPIENGIAATIRSKMRDAGFVDMDALKDVIESLAMANHYHPVKDYLLDLHWDGNNHIEQLSSYFTDEHNVFGLWMRKWLIGSCAKIFQAAQNRMLVLDGPQGLGKSEFVRWICPLTDYFIESAIDLDRSATDVYLRLAKFWVWEVGEFGATTRKSDFEALKGFLTTQTVTTRRPYDRYDTRSPAMSSFIGTVNEYRGLFSDPTGSRRFMMCRLKHIDWNYKSLDIHQIWAEAMAAYTGGENWHPEKDEFQLASQINEEYEIDDIFEGLLKKHFRIQANDESLWLPTVDILRILEDPSIGAVRGNTRSNAMELAATAKRLGLRKERRKNLNGQRVNGFVGITTLP